MAEIGFIILTTVILLLSLKKNKWIYFIVCALLFLLAAFRGIEVGTDTANYMGHFYLVESGYLLLKEEPLWIGILWLVSFFNGDFRTVLIITTLLIQIPVFWSIYKYSENPMLSLFFYYTLYFYFYSFNIIRQSIALSLIFLGIMLLMNGKRKIYFGLVIFASFMHISALVALVIPFVHLIPNKNYIYLITIIFTYIVGILLPEHIYSFGISLFYYEQHIDQNVGTLVGNALYMMIANTFFIFILYSIKKRDYIFNLFFISVVVTNLMIRIPYGGRVIMFFTIIQIIYFPLLIYKHRIKQKYIFVAVIILYAFIQFGRRLGAGGIFPYSNLLF